ncbi:hypothetical protein OG874_35195 [Nocardia sp. NBC_00565]|uniref:hypothetical protein n=1 Tax=Nocardia sp. NBC_00565 TaxID=2975993 RepID=UPI002E801D6D|nr:hypothetical protein [Nocardia sp. NBC_00565]WUC01945.1 hypothetical protein OG874_35195 [Nocardia sp. NBC_00565]
MADGAHAGRGVAGEPVLLSLTAPTAARRSLDDGLVRRVGAGEAGARILDADASDAEIADFLAGAVHSDGGFVARTSDGERALAIVAGTVAALCGEDIRAALARPDIAFLTSLKPPAVEAARSVLLAIETDAPDDLAGTLSILSTRK